MVPHDRLRVSNITRDVTAKHSCRCWPLWRSYYYLPACLLAYTIYIMDFTLSTFPCSAIVPVVPATSPSRQTSTTSMTCNDQSGETPCVPYQVHPLDVYSKESGNANGTKHLSTFDLAPESDTCPPYTCSVAFTSEAFLKQESSSGAVQPISQSNTSCPWKYVSLELRGTLLLVHPTCGTRSSPIRILLGRRPSQPQIYSLQNAKVGVAPDYEDRAWIIRVRFEEGKQQFLLALGTRETMAEWVEMLNLGIDIAEPLEGREMPEYCARRLPRLGPGL